MQCVVVPCFCVYIQNDYARKLRVIIFIGNQITKDNEYVYLVLIYEKQKQRWIITFNEGLLCLKRIEPLQKKMENI